MGVKTGKKTSKKTAKKWHFTWQKKVLKYVWWEFCKWTGRLGYEENYFCDCIIQQRDDYYEDSHGNRIFGAYQGLKFAFSGFHSTIRIGKDVTIKNCTVYIHNHSNLTIGDDVYFTDSIIRMDDKTRIEIGRGCQIQDLAVDARLMSDILLLYVFSIRLLPILHRCYELSGN